MELTRDEILFYASIGVATLLTEIANEYGVGICVYPPMILVVMYFGFRAFPAAPSDLSQNRGGRAKTDCL